MSLALAVRKAALAPGKWVSFPSALWRRAKAAPSLDLRFADNKSLVDAVTGQNLVTFTRASSGTYVGSDGVIRTAVTNLLLRSEEFDNASWDLAAGTRSANAATAPSGTLTADKLIAATSPGTTGQLFQAVTITSGATVTGSLFVKDGGFDRLEIVLLSNNNTTPYGRATFNPISGAITTAASTANGGTSVSANVVAYTNGWYRLNVTVTYPAVTAAGMRILLFNSDGAVGDGTKGVFLWGAQLEQSSTVGEYIPTTSTINSAPRFDHNPTTGESLGLLVEEQRTNLLLQSNGFDTTWVNSNSSETATAGIAPDGTNTAWELRDTSDASATGHSLAQSVPFTSGNAYTFTVWMKAGTLNEGGIAVPSSAFGATLINRVNLTTGAVISTTAGSTTIVTQFANGWYRVSLTATATATASGNSQIRPMNGGTTYIGTGTGTILIWGAQLEAGAFPTSYIPTTTATVTRSADVASITGANFSSWYRQDEGTIWANGTAPNKSVTGFRTRGFASISNGTQNESMLMGHSATEGAYRGSLFVGNVNQFAVNAQQTLLNVFTASNNYTARMCIAYKANDLIQSANGLLTSPVSSASLPVTDRLTIGDSLTVDGYLNGTIRRLTYWPQRLSNSTLQAVTQ